MKHPTSLKWIYDLSLPLGGDIHNTTGILFSYCLGSRNKYVIVDPKIIYFHIKKATKFVKGVSFNNLKMLFMCEIYNNFENEIFYLLLINFIYKSNHSCVTEKWSSGILTNYQTHFTDIFKLMFPVWKKRISYSMYWLLFKMFFFMKKTKLITMTWQQHFFLQKKYWKFFTYFKYYMLFNKLPSAGIYHNTVKNIHPAVEFEHLKIPSVGVVDTDLHKISYTYFVPGNDDSLLVGYFIFIVILRTYQNTTLLVN